MKKSLAKILIVCVVLILSIGLFCACNDNNEDENNEIQFDNIYHATLYDNWTDKLNDEYLLANSTKGALDVGYDLPYIEDTRPLTNIKVISDQQTYANAFEEFPMEIDFDKEMLILYFYTGDVPRVTGSGKQIFEFKIADMAYDKEKLEIKVRERCLVEGPTGCPPLQGFLAVKMDKLDVENVEFKF